MIYPDLTVLLSLLMPGEHTQEAMFKFNGKRLANLGVIEGKLAPPIARPNNVSSQAEMKDRRHYVAPFTLSGDSMAACQRLVELVQAQPRSSLITRSEGYFHAEFSSPVMGFVDDVEFALDFFGCALNFVFGAFFHKVPLIFD